MELLNNRTIYFIDNQHLNKASSLKLHYSAFAFEKWS